MAAQIKLTVKTNFDEASAQIKGFGDVTEKEAKRIQQAQKKFTSEKVDEYVVKNKRLQAAVTATRGKLEGLKVANRSLQRQMETMIRNGIDPQDKALQRLREQYDKNAESIEDMQNGGNKLKGIMGKIPPQAMAAAKAVTAVGAAVVAVGAAVVGASVAVKKFTDQLAEQGDNTLKASQRMGVSIEFYQRMASAAQHAGTEVSTTERSMKGLIMKLNQFEDGSKTAVKAFDDLGIQLKDNNGQLRSQESIYSDSLIALSKIENQTQRNAMATRLFGRAGSELAPMLDEGTEAIERYLNKNDSAVIITKEFAEASARYNDQVQTMGEQFDKSLKTGLEPFMINMSDLMDTIANSQLWDTALSGINNFGGALSWVAKKTEDLFIGLDYLLGGKKATEENLKQVNKIIATQKRLRDSIEQVNMEMEVADELGRDAPSYVKTRIDNSYKLIDVLKKQLKAQGKTADEIKLVTDVYAENIELAMNGELDKRASIRETTAFIKKQGEAIKAVNDDAEESEWWNFGGDNDFAIDGELYLKEVDRIAKARLAKEAENAEKLRQQRYDFQVKSVERFRVTELTKQDIANATATAIEQRNKRLQSNVFAAYKSFDTIMENTGNKTREFALLQKGISSAMIGFEMYKGIQAALNPLNNPFSTPAMRMAEAVTIGAKGLLGIGAVASTPIPSAETGGRFEVPMSASSNPQRVDSQLMRVNPGETVDVTPRGEESSKMMTVNVMLDNRTLWSSTQEGIDDGVITFTSDNLRN